MSLDFSPVFNDFEYLMHGTGVTIGITLASLVLSLVVGLFVGIARLKPENRVIYGLASIYVGFFRGTPLLVQLFIFFYGLPQLGVMLPAFFCGIIGLGLYSGAYVSEIVRGAIQSVDRGQIEAARSIGMSQGQAMRVVILPQAIVRMVPPLGNEVIALIKNSALVSLLTISDLMHEAQIIISTSYRSLEVYLAVALIYFILTSAAGWTLRLVEKRLRKKGGLQ